MTSQLFDQEKADRMYARRFARACWLNAKIGTLEKAKAWEAYDALRHTKENEAAG